MGPFVRIGNRIFFGNIRSATFSEELRQVWFEYENNDKHVVASGVKGMELWAELCRFCDITVED